jgi:hypothetical protein
MKPTDGGEIVCDLDKYAVYRNDTANVLVAIEKNENEQILELIKKYGSLENVPENLNLDFYVFQFDNQHRRNTFTETKCNYPLNQISPIFIWRQNR